MATKNLLSLILIAGTLTAQAQTTVLPERFEERFESTTTKQPNGRVEVYQKSTRVEEPGVELKQVRIGELVRISHMSPHPVIQEEFVYLQTRCRWFRDLVQYQVIACQVQPNVWQVVDKF